MKTQMHFILLPMIVFVLAACGDKKGTTYKNSPPPPAPAATEKKKKRTTVETETEADGEGDLPSGRQASPKKLPPKVKPIIEDEDYDGLATDEDKDLSAPARPPRLAQPAQPYVMPPLQGTPALAWLNSNVEPILGLLQFSGPPPQMQGRAVRVTIALGYFDGSHTEDFQAFGVSYGRHVAVDPFLRSAVHAVLTRQCQGMTQLCGFQEAGGDDLEKIYQRAGMNQEVRVFSGALTPLYQQNVRARSEEQASRSARAQSLFTRSLTDSDLVVYIGHSREGGGPDFKPARLLSSGAVDYPYYQKKREGARRLVEAVSQSNRKATTLAIMSCDSSDHFQRELRRAAPNMELLTTSGAAISAQKLLSAGLLSAEMFLRQGRSAEANEIAAERVRELPSLRVSSPSALAER